jgi:hypothetical protein
MSMGSTQQKWYAKGYQAALRDLFIALEVGGEEGARTWIENNEQEGEIDGDS